MPGIGRTPFLGMKLRRPGPDLDVVARFLDRLREGGEGAPHAKLQAATRLDYDLYRACLSLLLRKGWLEVRGGGVEGEHVSLTGKGRHPHDALVGRIRDAFGDIRL